MRQFAVSFAAALCLLAGTPAHAQGPHAAPPAYPTKPV